MDKKKKEQKKDSFRETREELDKCRKERDEYLSGWQRAQADFINYKKMEMDTIDEARENAANEIILEVLRIFDILELAKKRIPDEDRNSKWVQGIFAIGDRFQKFLKDRHIEEINPLGEDFNPRMHEAVEQINSGGESGKVIEVVEKGYAKIGGKLLRPAKVKVSK